MNTVHAIYEQGVFRPVERVELPDHSLVEFEPRLVNPNNSANGADAEVIAILSERYESGQQDVAARHDEHQP